MLDREKLDAVLLNAQHNFAWLTGGGRNGVDQSRESGAASLLLTRTGERFVLASVIEIERMLTEELSENDFQPLDFSWQAEKADGGLVIEKACSVLTQGASIATDIALQHDIPTIEHKIAPCRYELTENEAQRFRELGRDAAAAADRTIAALQPGQSEREAAAAFRRELAAGNMDSVVTLVAADERIARYRHPVPTEKRWHDTLMLVTCARRGGLIASLTRVICAGAIPDELRSRTEAAAIVNAKLLASTMPGTAGAELYSAAAKGYEGVGFAGEIDRHHQGGATGYKTREWVAHPQSKETVRPNQAFAWNPSIAGTKVEETCIAGVDGVEVLTSSSNFPHITVTIDGIEFRSPGILSLSKGASA